jgi:hypothetical protein
VFVTLPLTADTDATIRRLWASRLGIAKMFSRAIVDYPDLRSFLLYRPTPHARALAAATVTLSTHPSFTPAAKAAILSELETLAQLPTPEAALPSGVR